MRIPFLFCALATLLPPPAFAAGPTISGGGNADEAPTTPYLIASAIDEAKEHYLPHFFAALETSYETTKLYFERHGQVPGEDFGALLPVGAKLFPAAGKQDAFALLAAKRIHWDLRSDKPCYDQDGQESDGSATLPDTICISLLRLTEGPNKLNRSDYVRRTVALAAHEVSHLLGADEPEAKWVQGQANTAGLDSTERQRSFPYWKLVDALGLSLDDLIQQTDAGASFDSVCATMRALAPNTPSAGDLFQNWAPARAEAELRLNAVSAELGVLLPVVTCSAANNAAEKPYFGGKSDTSLADLLAAAYRKSIGPVEPIVADDERILWISYGDATALRAELAHLKTLIERVRAFGQL